MTDKMACTGVLVDLRPMKVSGNLRAVIEFPKEMANEVHDRLGGYPRPDVSRWVALAVMEAGHEPDDSQG